MKINKKLIPYVLMASLTVGGLVADKIPYATFLTDYNVERVIRLLKDDETRFQVTKKEAQSILNVIKKDGQGVSTEKEKPKQVEVLDGLREKVEKHIAMLEAFEKSIIEATSEKLGEFAGADALQEALLKTIAKHGKHGILKKNWLAAKRVCWDDRGNDARVLSAIMATAALGLGVYVRADKAAWGLVYGFGSWTLGLPGRGLNFAGYEFAKKVASEKA